MPNFNIIEGDDFFDSIHDEFLLLYNNGVKVSEIIERLNITTSQYHNFRRRLIRTGEIKTARNPKAGKKKVQGFSSRSNPKNYYYNRFARCYAIVHCEEYYGTFRDCGDAKKFVELMRECNWDKSRKDELRQKVLNGV